MQDMMVKAIKGAGNNKMLPITGMMLLEANSGKLSLRTTDSDNYLYLSQDIESQDNLSVVVPVEQFSKLVSKLTSDFVELELVDGKLVVKGNGTYKIELPLDEEGNLITYPNPIAKEDLHVIDKIQLATIKSILQHNKPCLDSLDNSCYNGYYVDEVGVLTTDTLIMCDNMVNFLNHPVLISREMMDLLDVFTDNEVEVYENETHLVFSTPSCAVYGNKKSGIEDYQVEALRGLVREDFTNMVQLSSYRFINALDRLSLFVGKYDRNKVLLSFEPQGLKISSINGSGVEVLEYSNKDAEVVPFNCVVDIELLSSQLKAQESATIQLWYGVDKAIKMVDGIVNQIIALDDEA